MITDDYTRNLIQKYQRLGVLVDTNILLLYFVGSANLKRITKFKRTAQFQISDYELVKGAFGFFQRIVTTPHILTEVYNFLNQLQEPDRRNSLLELAKLVKHLDKFDEIYVESQQVVELSGFPIFGLTDCAIESLAKDHFLVLTDDAKLASYLGKSGIEVLNFNHIRMSRWS